MSEQTQTLGQRLRKIRRELHQFEFAKQLGISVAAASNYENDHRSPDAKLFLNIAREYGADLHWLITGEDRNKPTGQTNLLAHIAEHVDLNTLEDHHTAQISTAIQTEAAMIRLSRMKLIQDLLGTADETPVEPNVGDWKEKARLEAEHRRQHVAQVKTAIFGTDGGDSK